VSWIELARIEREVTDVAGTYGIGGTAPTAAVGNSTVGQLAIRSGANVKDISISSEATM
jgi:hypothetical protein